ncbi:uncharacterized protein LOC123894216 [Trifolium pratense]|uniref:uncharacterized protein LOC123894216 n=1 Tax=Trifolium pratense TaxID=57577 RepID=UPI001E697498|nr:uncharacterized protein LOC123894216 [Trifolium pratense]
MASSDQTLVCVKQVKQEVTNEWDETMPLPGDIIEGFSIHDVDDVDESFLPVKTSSEFSSQLGKINPSVDSIWIKVRRGDSLLKLQTCVVQQKGYVLRRKYTVQATTDHRHIVDLADLTLKQCIELQVMTRRVDMQDKGFHKDAIKYDWKMKVGTYLPHQSSSVVSSILFMPLISENCINTTTARCMAWFSAAISSGVPLVFVNIQTELIPPTIENTNLSSNQQIHCTAQIIHGIRLWFLPGLEEIPIELIPQRNEARFGMEIKRTEEGFVCIYSVMKDTSADRGGLRELHEEATANGFLLVISRLDDKNTIPTSVCSDGLIHCCDHAEIKNLLISALGQYETIQLHVMAWPNQTRSSQNHVVGFSALLPPESSFPIHQYD